MDKGTSELVLIKKYFKHIPYDLILDDFSNTVVWELLNKLKRILNDKSKHYIKYSHNNDIIIKNSIVHPSATLSPYIIIKDSYISENVSIGSFCELSRCIMLNNSKAGRSDYIGRSIVGNNVIVSGNVRTATRRMDLDYPKIKEIGLYSPFKRIGCFIGDNSFLSSTIQINPFTFICPNTKVYPFQSLRGIIKNGDQ